MRRELVLIVRALLDSRATAPGYCTWLLQRANCPCLLPTDAETPGFPESSQPLSL